MPIGAIRNRKTVLTATCAACGRKFACRPNHEPRAECCTPVHRGTDDGCCACVLRKRRRRAKAPEFMSPQEIRAFLKSAREVGEGFYLAFRLGINAMLSPRALMSLRPSSLDPYRERGECAIGVGDMLIETDCETLDEISKWTEGSTGALFPWTRRVLWGAFRKALANGNIYSYTMHTLRHTGIRLRAQYVRTPADIEALRKSARLRKLSDLRPYLESGESDLNRRIRFVK